MVLGVLGVVVECGVILMVMLWVVVEDGTKSIQGSIDSLR